MQDIERALKWNVLDHQSSEGRYYSKRYQGLADDIVNSSSLELWQYFRIHEDKIGPVASVVDEGGRRWTGINVASQDYLGLSQDERVIDGAVAAMRALGAHSSGAAGMGGGSSLAKRIEAKLASVLNKEHVVLFPTGWSAGYGQIAALVRPHDHVVIDALAHNCLQHGAKASTPNVHKFIHNSAQSLETRLKRIREKEPDAAILIVTESLFSMDSDGPDLRSYVELKQRYDAHLMLDIAHDFGVLGDEGRGLATRFGGYDGVDYVMGSFSKTFAAIGGFTATADLASSRAVQGYSGSYTFSNYLTPAQLGAIDASIDIVFSPEGDLLRTRLQDSSRALRATLGSLGYQPHGELSALCIVQVGSEAVARLAYRELLHRGVILNCIEYPAVRKGEARFRLQLTPHHTAEQIADVARHIASALGKASSDFDRLQMAEEA